jgi:hypothetical protein
MVERSLFEGRPLSGVTQQLRGCPSGRKSLATRCELTTIALGFAMFPRGVGLKGGA